MSESILVLVTIDTAEAAARLTRTLVEERLAACGNILPGVTSIYRWQGKVEQSAEVLIILKTERPLFESLRARVAELHSYDVPEVIQLDVTAGNANYLQWISDSVGVARST